MAVATKVACIAVLCVVLSATLVAEAAVTCGTVASSVSPCVNYLRVGGAVPPPCCAGIRNLAGAARTPVDRKTACNCLKSTAASIPGINFGRAAALPGACKVNVPYKISPSTDCNRVN